MKKVINLLIILFFISSCKNNENITPPSSEKTSRYEFTVDTIQYGDSSKPLKGVLFTPKIENNIPSIIMIPGSGPVNLDGITSGVSFYPYFKEIAESLAVRGFAVLRYDKHYMTYPPANPLSIAESTQVADIIHGANYLKNLPNFNSKKIFGLGHSEGGSLLPVAASREKGLFSGLICAATTFIPVDTLFIGQLKAKNVANNLVEQTQIVFDAIRSGMADSNWNIWGAGKKYWEEWIYYSEMADSFLIEANIPILLTQGLNDENFPGELLTENISRMQSIADSLDNTVFKVIDYSSHCFLDSSKSKLNNDNIIEIINWINVN